MAKLKKNQANLISTKYIKLVQKHGFEHVKTVGSHWHFKHPVTGHKVTVQHPKDKIPLKTRLSMLEQAGLDKDLLI